MVSDWFKVEHKIDLSLSCQLNERNSYIVFSGNFISLAYHHFYNVQVLHTLHHLGFPGGSDGKGSAYNAGDPGSIPGSRKFPGEGNSNPF